MRHFLKDRAGNFTVMFAIASLPVIGAAGVAADYSRALNVRSFMQAQTDAAALAAGQLGPAGNQQPHLDYLVGATYQRYGEDKGIKGLSVSSFWTGSVDYRVDLKGQMPVALLGGLPGFPSHVDIAVSSTVRIAEPRYVYKAPTVNELDNEAGDYNRVSVYCFDPEKKNDPKTKGRTQMTPISDNAFTKYDYQMPRCDAGQALSFKLLNVRQARTQPHLWETGTPRFDYYTDTVLDQLGAEKHDISCAGHQVCSKPPASGWSIMETVLCDTKQQCDPKHAKSIIPSGKNRVPQQAKASCSPGKYMYYGWEDRPPGLESYGSSDWTQLGWTDRDYDDIRIVLACPELEKVEERSVRLIK